MPLRTAADERAFRTLVDRHGPRLYAVAYGILGDAAAAESVVQDAFVRLARAEAQMREAGAVAGWLYRVAVNLCRDELRRRRRAARMVPLELVEDSLPASELASIPGDASPEDDALWRCLERLPRKLREVVLLRFMSDLSYAELADLLGVSIGTVSSRLHRALRRLGTQLSHLQRNVR
jgi:RNA polymerase sigma-70 factor, ECF subfamily